MKNPDPNPYFFKGERYQGASRIVYPCAMIDDFTDDLVDKEYEIIILQNEHIEICIVPELGGKMLYAKDKSNDYFFIYRNQVVKPALIGMTGAWTSEELNGMFIYRATTFSEIIS